MPNLTGKKNLQNFGITHYFNLSHELIMFYYPKNCNLGGVDIKIEERKCEK